MTKRFTILLLFAAAALYGQNAANSVVNPLFTALDQNGQPLPLAQLCAYQAGTTAPTSLFADSGGMAALPNPVTMNGGGQAKIYGLGNYKLVLSQPSSSSSCPASGATIWTYDNVFIQGEVASFQSVVAVLFNCTATGSNNCVQQDNGTFAITGAGNAAFQTVTATTTFNSGATGTTPAFTINVGSAELLGNGNMQDQQDNTNQFEYQPYASPTALYAACTSCTQPGSGIGVVFYNSATGSLQENLNNAGWVNVATVPGVASGVPYVCGGAAALCSSTTFEFDGTNLVLSGATNTGVIAPVFNSSNTGSNNAFQTGSGDFYVTGAGNVGAQSITINNTAGTTAILTGTASNTDTAGIANLVGGTLIVPWPSGHSYVAPPFCVVAVQGAVPHPIAVIPSSSGMTLNGSFTDTIAWHCYGTVF